MAVDSTVFPRELSALGVRSAWRTDVIELGGGNEQRNVGWSDARRRYDATTNTLTLTQYLDIEKHFNGRRGRGRAFPLRDRSLFRATNEPFGTGDGATTTFQLKVASGDGGNAYQREIYLVEALTYSVADNGTPVVEGSGAGKFQLSLSGSTAGIVTFGTAPTSGHALTWSGDFYIPVRYDIDELPGAELFIWTSATNGLVKGPSIPLIEVRYAGEF